MTRPLTPIFDPVTRYGGPPVKPIVYTQSLVGGGSMSDTRDTAAGTAVSTLPSLGLLYDEFLALSPTSMWTIREEDTSAGVVDIGSLGNDMAFTFTPSSSLVGPDGFTYPLLGVVVNGGAHSGTDYDTYFSTGMTLLLAMRSTNVGELGVMLQKTDGANNGADRDMRIVVDKYIQGLVQKNAGTGSKTTTSNAQWLVLNQWIIWEVYFPPGQSFAVIYVDGIEVAQSTVSFGSVTSSGSGRVYVGSAGDAGHVAPRGYYALPTVLLRELTAGERSDYRAAAMTEGWIT